MKLSRLALVVLAPLALSACGVPDLVAHGVKSYEKSQDRRQQPPEMAQPAQPTPQPARYDPEPEKQWEPVGGPMPPRETIVSEPLR